MKYKLVILFLFALNASFAQSVSQLELELRETVITDLDKIKSICDKIFLVDKYNEIAVSYLVEGYKSQSDDYFGEISFGEEHKPKGEIINYTDSIAAFFNRLIECDKNNPTPYLLQAKILCSMSPVLDSCKISLLQTAIKLDKNNVEGNYLLGEEYYDGFILDVKDSTSDNEFDYASKAFEYLKVVYQKDSSSKFLLSYPLLQLASYLNKTDADLPINIPQNNEYYFPLLAFADIPENWEKDFTINLIWELIMATSKVGAYSMFLKAMREPIIFNNQVEEVYRFTLLRTFENPIAIRIIKKENEITLIWKQSDGAGGSTPGNLIIDKSRELSSNEWNTFQTILSGIDFWKLPTNDPELSGNDGSQWILEGASKGKYHVVDRWMPGNTGFSNVCLYLLDQTDLKIRNKEKY